MHPTVAEPVAGTFEVWHPECIPTTCKVVAPVNHILIVDDDPSIRDVVSDILEMSDYRVKTACNGAEALNDIRDDRPAAVLLDLMMPVMNGWEFLHTYRCQCPVAQVPVVIMSAGRDASVMAGELGAQAFLSKPFEMDAILAVVGRVATGASHSGGEDPIPDA
jgi:DNA-binding response OmpR family regulator